MKKLLIICGTALLGLVFTLNHFEPAVQAQGPVPGNYLYISTATTTAVKDGQGFLIALTINGGTAGAVTLFDIAAQSCTGTPSTGKFATVEAISATNPVTLPYNLRVSKGLCIVTGQATDLTVSVN